MGKERRRSRRKETSEGDHPEKRKTASVLAVASRKKGNRRVMSQTVNRVNQERSWFNKGSVAAIDDQLMREYAPSVERKITQMDKRRIQVVYGITARRGKLKRSQALRKKSYAKNSKAARWQRVRKVYLQPEARKDARDTLHNTIRNMK